MLKIINLFTVYDTCCKQIKYQKGRQVIMLAKLFVRFMMCVCLCATLAQADEVVLQNGLEGYDGCEDQLLIMDERTSGFMDGWEAPNYESANVCYYRC